MTKRWIDEMTPAELIEAAAFDNLKTFQVVDQNGEMYLDCDVTGVGRDKIAFYVNNGAWYGSISKDGVVKIDFTGKEIVLAELGMTLVPTASVFPEDDGYYHQDEDGVPY